MSSKNREEVEDECDDNDDADYSRERFGKGEVGDEPVDEAADDKSGDDRYQHIVISIND